MQPDSLYLQCCHRRLLVTIDEALRDKHGHSVYGLFDSPTRTIHISRQTPRDKRRETLVKMLSHAFNEIAGAVDMSDDEARVNRMALIESQFSESLAKAGGERAIHKLFGDADLEPVLPEPTQTRFIVTDDQSPWPTEVSCPNCHRGYESRFIANSKPAFDPRLDGFVMWRFLACPPCKRAFKWVQASTPAGMPIPKTIALPTSEAMV